MPHYEKLLIQIVNMAHICENDMIQLKDMFQIVATWLQLSTEEYTNCYITTVPKGAFESQGCHHSLFSFCKVAILALNTL